MIKLGVNTVLFAKYDLLTAMTQIKNAGFDHAEIAALGEMCNHLPIEDDWKSKVPEIKKISEDLDLPIRCMEAKPATEEEMNLKAIEAAAELGISFVNTTPGKTDMGNQEQLSKIIDSLNRLGEKAKDAGVTITLKAHVNSACATLEDTQKLLTEVTSEGFAVDIDCSHMFRMKEDPAEALKVIYPRIKHIHIRDCVTPEGFAVGEPYDQACGRGLIDIHAYLKVLVDNNYDGPVDLEVIGTHKDQELYTLERCTIIAAESRGYLNSALRSLGVR